MSRERCSAGWPLTLLLNVLEPEGLQQKAELHQQPSLTLFPLHCWGHWFININILEKTATNVMKRSFLEMHDWTAGFSDLISFITIIRENIFTNHYFIMITILFNFPVELFHMQVVPEHFHKVRFHSDLPLNLLGPDSWINNNSMKSMKQEALC